MKMNSNMNQNNFIWNPKVEFNFLNKHFGVIAWKKCALFRNKKRELLNNHSRSCLVKLFVPLDGFIRGGFSVPFFHSKYSVTSLYTPMLKLRAPKAFVLDKFFIENENQHGNINSFSLGAQIPRKSNYSAVSLHSCYLDDPTSPFTYKVGKWVYPKNTFDYSVQQCSSGIHFYLTVEEALKHF